MLHCYSTILLYSLLLYLLTYLLLYPSSFILRHITVNISFFDLSSFLISFLWKSHTPIPPTTTPHKALLNHHYNHQLYLLHSLAMTWSHNVIITGMFAKVASTSLILAAPMAVGLLHNSFKPTAAPTVPPSSILQVCKACEHFFFCFFVFLLLSTISSYFFSHIFALQYIRFSTHFLNRSTELNFCLLKSP